MLTTYSSPDRETTSAAVMEPQSCRERLGRPEGKFRSELISCYPKRSEAAWKCCSWKHHEKCHCSPFPSTVSTVNSSSQEHTFLGQHRSQPLLHPFFSPSLLSNAPVLLLTPSPHLGIFISANTEQILFQIVLKALLFRKSLIPYSSLFLVTKLEFGMVALFLSVWKLCEIGYMF